MIFFENAERAEVAEGGRHGAGEPCAFLRPSARSAPSAFSDWVLP